MPRDSLKQPSIKFTQLVLSRRWRLHAGAVMCALVLGCELEPSPDAGTDGGAAGPDVENDAGPPPADAGDVDAGAPAHPCGELAAGLSEGHEGQPGDTEVQPARAVVVMGGSSEVDAASKVFVESAGGGDVLVLRASGSVESYTPYFFDELDANPAPASSATIRIDAANASDDAALHCRIQAAESLWLAGGDQWDYLGAWNPSVAAAVNPASAIGGTSAGAMVLSEFAFSAEFGSVTSEEALANPAAADVSVVSSAFAQPEFARCVIDTHFSARDREGRLLAFASVARAIAGEVVWAIGLDERVALVVTEGRFEVMAGADDRAVWLYRLDSAPLIQGSLALTMSDIVRFRLDDGATGAWPPNLDDATGVKMSVQSGAVVVE